MIDNVMPNKGVAKNSVLWILLAIAPGLPIKATVTFGRLPGTTCGVLGGEAHLVWDYNDDGDTVNVIRWFNGTDAGPDMGTYITGPKTFTAFPDYTGKIGFAAPKNVSGFKSAGLTFYGLEASDAGIYTTIFQANTNTKDIGTLEVAEAADLGTWEICDDDDTCKAISDPLTLPASGNVTAKFTKSVTLSCDMEIDVAPSVGPIFVLVVPAGPGATAEHTLADAATLLTAGSLSIYLAFGKNGEVFHTDNGTIANVSIVSDCMICEPNPCQNQGTCSANADCSADQCICPPNYVGDRCEISGQSPTPAQAAAIAFGVIFIIVGIILVAVVLFKGNKKAGLKLADKVCVGVGVGLCVIGCILVVVFVAELTYLTSAEIAGACVAVCVVTVVILIVIVVVWYKMKAPSVEGGANGTPMQKSPDDRVTKPTHAHDVGNGGDVAARPLPSRPAGRLSPLHNSVTPENQEDDPTRTKKKHKKKKSKKGHREDEDYQGTEEA